MPGWQYTVQGTKTAVATALGSATLANAVSMDSPPDVLSGAPLTGHFNAAIASAVGQLAALVGNAPNARVQLVGYLDINATPPIPVTGASRIDVLVSEFWT
jgi:hypothetical protein